jgi:hypothetical protein
MGSRNTSMCFYVMVLTFLANAVFAQNLKQEKMEQLNFMIGEWVGTSKMYTNGVVTKQGAAYENISYDLTVNTQ